MSAPQEAVCGTSATSAPPAPRGRGTAGEVFVAFLTLGLTSFGGPVAHLGYFRDAFVLKRRWLSEADYADLLALCQFLPGPASSQTGFALGTLRAGSVLGGLAAWAGFTLPSALILAAFAMTGASSVGAWQASLHGLQLVAVAVVAQALFGMARTLAPDRQRAALALAAMAIVTLSASAVGQIAAIALGALLGTFFLKAEPASAPANPDARVGAHLRKAVPVSRRAGLIVLCAFGVLLVGLPVAARLFESHGLTLAEAFYRAGALVFGGGHVVLPLLENTVVRQGWVAPEAFLAGYGLAQAVPGPLFTFAAYLGAVMAAPPTGWAGAAIALVSIFLPGLLLVYGMLPYWDAFRLRPGARAAMRGTNAAVVGILAAALYDPVWVHGMRDGRDVVLVAAGFIALTVWKWPPLAVVAALTAATAALSAL